MTAEGRRHFATAEEFEEFKSQVHAAYTYRFGDFWINTATRECSAGRLGPMEFEMLELLVKACPDQVHTVRLAAEMHLESDSVKGYIRRIRRVIGYDRIATIPAAYRFVPFPTSPVGG